MTTQVMSGRLLSIGEMSPARLSLSMVASPQLKYQDADGTYNSSDLHGRPRFIRR